MKVIDSIHTRLDLKGARAELEQRLRDGREVGGLNLSGLIDSELYGEHWQRGRDEAIRIITADYLDTPLLQSRLIERLIRQYLDENEHLIHECACEMFHEEQS